jgi:hypothetical protein
MDETEMKKMFELSQQNSANSGLEITPEVSPPLPFSREIAAIYHAGCIVDDSNAGGREVQDGV